MKEVIQKIHDICSGHKYCTTDCPFFDTNVDTLDESCIFTSSPYTWNVDKIADILERISRKEAS